MNEGEDTRTPDQTHQSRDKKLVMKMNIPLTVENIINTSMEVFNDLVCTWEATEEQINVCRDIRRRGKNKVVIIVTILVQILEMSQFFLQGFRFLMSLCQMIIMCPVITSF